MNSAASLAAGLPVGKLSVRCLVVACYVAPAVLTWALLGALLAALSMAVSVLAGPVLAGSVLASTWLVAAACYGGYYGLAELARGRGLAPPGRRWQVPQSMMIDASPWRRLLVWGAVLGPGFLTRNPYAGFGVLPLAVAAMTRSGTGAALALAAAIGLAHGAARATALLRDVSAAQAVPVTAGAADGQLDLLLKAVYWRRLDGAILLAIAATATALAVGYL